MILKIEKKAVKPRSGLPGGKAVGKRTAAQEQSRSAGGVKVAAPNWRWGVDGWPVFQSTRQAAKLSGVPVAVLKAASLGGCQAFVGQSVYFGEFLRWHFGAMRDKALPDGFATQGDFLNSIKAQREKLALAKDEGKAVDVAEARRQAKDAVGFYFAELDRLTRELPPLLKGLDEGQIHAALDKAMRDLKQHARAKFDAVAEPAP